MKNLLQLILLTVFTLTVTSGWAQMSNKEMRKTLKLNPPKEVRKEAKKYEKNGYKVAVGAPTIERQLVKAWLKEVEYDENGYPAYIVAGGNSVGETQIAAKMQATEAAKLELAGTLATNIASIVESKIANDQLNTEDAASVTETIAASKSIIAQELGRVINLVEMYKKIGQNVEANIRIAYNNKLAMDLAKKVIRDRLRDETNILQEKLENLMDF